MTTDDIKQLIEKLLAHMNVTFDAIEVSDSDGRDRFSIKTADSHKLIGTKGAHLQAINHVVKKIVASKGERTFGEGGANAAPEKAFFVDVNGYQEAAVESIKQIAKVMGERARSFKTSVELEPMSSYERMVIHAFFQEAQDLKTESIGEGDRRRVVIKYMGEN